jgi:predicted alpha/beta superfamily hydrolase
LPAGYGRFSRKRYPVLYLQDGQNVFDAATSFSYVEWGVDETAQRLIRQNLLEPMIIVAIANMGDDRVHEYAPTRGLIDSSAKRKKRSKGLAREYGRFLIEELKPYIDRKYRTKREPEFTGLGGSSLGGLLTLSLGIWFSNVFTRLLVMSPSVWWDNQVIVKMVEELDRKLPLKIWLDSGTAEPGWENTRKLLDALVEKGWKLFDDLQYHEIEGGDHSEAAWATRVDPALRFLFPAPGGGPGCGGFGSGIVGIARTFSLKRLTINLKDTSKSTGKLLVLLKLELPLCGQPLQFARTIRVVRIVSPVMITPIGRALALVLVNQNGVVDVQNRKIRKIRNEEIAPSHGSLHQLVLFFLITVTVQKEHPKISNPQVSGPAMSDISF